MPDRGYATALHVEIYWNDATYDENIYTIDKRLESLNERITDIVSRELNGLNTLHKGLDATANYKETF